MKEIRNLLMELDKVFANATIGANPKKLIDQHYKKGGFLKEADLIKMVIGKVKERIKRATELKYDDPVLVRVVNDIRVYEKDRRIGECPAHRECDRDPWKSERFQAA